MIPEMEPQDNLEEVSSNMASTSVQEDLANLLINPLILERVLFHASFADLLNYRLVNQFWKHVATPILSEKCAPVEINLGSDEKLKKLNNLLTPHFPCTAFSVSGRRLGRAWTRPPSCSKKREKHRLAFFKKVAPWITSLHVQNICEEELYQAESTLSRHPGICFPHLKSLTAHFSLQGFAMESGFGDWILKLNLLLVKFIQSRAIPGLQLQLSLDTSGMADLNILRRRLQMFREHGGTCWITHINVTRLSDEIIRILVGSGLLQLKSCCIYFEDIPTTKLVTLTVKTLVWLLESQCAILESLQLLQCRGYHVQELITLSKAFPRLTNLILEVPLRVPPLTDYAHIFPALKNLGIPGTCFKPLKVYVLDLRDTAAMETVTHVEYSVHISLRTERGEEPKGHDMIPHIARAFPHLTKLTLPSRRTMLKKVYQESWPHLEELVLIWKWDWKWPGCSPDEALMQVRRFGWFGLQKRTTSLLQRLYSRMKPAPLLTQLKVLQIKPRQLDFHQPYPSVFSDAACQLVLLKLDNLTCLDLRGCQGLKYFIVSPEMIGKMQEKFEVLL